MHNGPSRSSKVINFGTNRKRVHDFLLDFNNNLGPILPRFRDIRAFVRQKPLFRYPSLFRPIFRGCSPWNRSVVLGSAESEHPKLTNREIISNLCDQDTSTSRTDGQTDRRTTCRSNTELCVASRGKNNGPAFEGHEWRYTSAVSYTHLTLPTNREV